jgi:chemotaxis signal transduction protein
MNPEPGSLVPSFVIFQVGTRRVALPRDCVAEMIASPLLFSFPHTTPVISGVVLRRGRIVPVLDLGPGLLGAASPAARFFLVVERRISNISERCAIPIQGECELVAANMLPSEESDEFVIGCLNHNGAEIDVLDLEKSIKAGAKNREESMVAAEALS